MYDDIANVYHLVYEDWDTAIARQAKAFKKIIDEYTDVASGSLIVLDVSCGIGTQSLGLADLGYRVTGSDLSERSIERACHEAKMRGLEIDFMVADMREVHAVHGSGFDVVISADNALPHLPDHHEVELALRAFYACLANDGLVIIGLRDYKPDEIRTQGQVWPYGFRTMAGERYYVFQTRDWHGDSYRVGMYFVREQSDQAPADVISGVSTYHAITTEEVMGLMLKTGFTSVACLTHLKQPVLVGRKS